MTESPLIIGIDPGLEGALCLLGGGPARVLDLPTRQDERTGRRIDGFALARLLQGCIPVDVPVLVFLESIANGGMGKGRTNASTVGSQFWTQSAIVTTLELLGLTVHEFVPVPTWKKLYGIGGKAGGEGKETQRRVRELAVQLYPELADHLQRQKDHNRAESVLIAHWARKVRA